MVKYFHTIIHLKLIQILYRLLRPLLRRKKNSVQPEDYKYINQDLLLISLFNQQLSDDNSFSFSGITAKVDSFYNLDQQQNLNKLWLYNLHYFNDLSAYDFKSKKDAHKEIINDWVNEYNIIYSIGWDPYPISLRIVNWIKYFSENPENISPKHILSLAAQSEILSYRLEYHLLGNHLFANGKALVFSGIVLEGPLSNMWLERGLQIIDKELKEQFLEDGGHFELSPMYHSLLIVDLLDLINLAIASNHSVFAGRLEEWKGYFIKGYFWLETMCHPDGEISFFNDSTFNNAPSLDTIFNYAKLLEIDLSKQQKEPIGSFFVTHLKQSGYININSDAYKMIIDVAKVGPEYLPGHAHADTLSFELSIKGKRIFVNSGTSEYGISAERSRQRGTAAHNTVTINDYDSSETWAGFRVARRAYPLNTKINQSENKLSVSSAHNGYCKLKGHPIHTRKFEFFSDKIIITDFVSPTSPFRAKAHFHFNPEATVQAEKNKHNFKVLIKKIELKLHFCNTENEIMQSTWHPEFGKTLSNMKIISGFSHQNTVTITW